MGGGDLNMKKHFHPLTMQNLERVWKAEQKAKDEAEKLEQLQRELEEERRREALQQHAIEQGIAKKKNEKLDWMYAGPQVNHEEYLLGRKIDKNVEILKEEDDKPNEKPGASFIADISDPVKDMAAKIKEDPLFLIRKKEEESKKELIQNPIKLRKLKEMLNLSVKEQKKSKKAKKSKHKKERKERKRRHDTDSDSEEDSRGDHRIKRRKEKGGHARENGYSRGKGHRNQYDGMEVRSRRDRSYSSSSDDTREAGSRSRRHDDKRRANERKVKREHDVRRDEHHKIKERKMDQKRERSREVRMSSTERKERSGRHDSSHKKGHFSKKYIQRDSSSENESDSSDNEGEIFRSDSHVNGHAMNKKRENNYGLYHPKADSSTGSHDRKAKTFSTVPKQRDMEKSRVKDGKAKDRSRHDTSSDSSSNGHHSRRNGYSKERNGSKYERSKGGREVKQRNGPPPRMISDNVSRKLTQEELEKKRQEMMENAKWRDDQRGKNVQKYKMEEEKEANEEKRRAISPDSKAQFIHDMQVKSYSSSQTSSVEDRIKRNIYTKQRTRDALSKKFTEK